MSTPTCLCPDTSLFAALPGFPPAPPLVPPLISSSIQISEQPLGIEQPGSVGFLTFSTYIHFLGHSMHHPHVEHTLRCISQPPTPYLITPCSHLLLCKQPLQTQRLKTIIILLMIIQTSLYQIFFPSHGVNLGFLFLFSQWIGWAGGPKKAALMCTGRCT